MTDAATDWPARAEAHVKLDAIAANCRRLVAELKGGAGLCAVVKADGYGHGMIPAARAALAGGAERLAVVTIDEAELLAAAFATTPVLVMAPVAPQHLGRAVASGAELTVWNERQVREIAAAAISDAATAASRSGSATSHADAPTRLHIKRDTGMGRFGARAEVEALAALSAAKASAGVEPHAVWTHFATADEDDRAYFERQLATFESFVATARAIHPGLAAHAANSAAALREPRSHLDFVRCGIAIYGLDPFHDDATARNLEPAMSLTSRVATVREFEPGDSTGYGRRFVTERPTRIATVPIGYGDGWRRILGNRCEVLIGGRRYSQVGTVSMDSITVDLGPAGHDAPSVGPGDLVTLIGGDGDQRISAEQVARQAETINYEITCGLTPRTRRTYTGDT